MFGKSTNAVAPSLCTVSIILLVVAVHFYTLYYALHGTINSFNLIQLLSENKNHKHETNLGE